MRNTNVWSKPQIISIDGIEAVRIGLEAAETGRSKPMAEAIREWEAL